MLAGPAEWSVWRAPTDNDRHVRLQWEEAGYDRAVVKVRSCRGDVFKGLVRIETSFAMASVYRQPFLYADAVFTVDSYGRIDLQVQAKRDTIFPYLPRFGIMLPLKGCGERVDYRGFGPYESYRDKHLASWYGHFETDVTSLWEDYVKPQENGSHTGCCEVTVGEWKAASEVPFSFSASHHTDADMTGCRHNTELPEREEVFWHLDYAQSGIGSNSCGPVLAEKYRLDEEEIRWRIRLIPQK